MLMTYVVSACLILTLSGVLALEAPCQSGQSQCNGSLSFSVVNNVHYCCQTGYNMQWKSSVVNGTRRSDCVCHRYYTESECLEGAKQCTGASSMTSDGTTVKCCQQGDSMNSVTNAFINGVAVSYCKCIRYDRGSGVGGSIVNNFGSSTGWINGRPMTPEELTKFNEEMAKWQQGMQQWSRDFSNQMSSMFSGFGNRLSGGLNNLRTGFGNRRMGYGGWRGFGNRFRFPWTSGRLAIARNPIWRQHGLMGIITHAANNNGNNSNNSSNNTTTTTTTTNNNSNVNGTSNVAPTGGAGNVNTTPAPFPTQ